MGPSHEGVWLYYCGHTANHIPTIKTPCAPTKLKFQPWMLIPPFGVEFALTSEAQVDVDAKRLTRTSAATTPDAKAKEVHFDEPQLLRSAREARQDRRHAKLRRAFGNGGGWECSPPSALGYHLYVLYFVSFCILFDLELPIDGDWTPIKNIGIWRRVQFIYTLNHPQPLHGRWNGTPVCVCVCFFGVLFRATPILTK